ncbi:hypothetical protein PRK78_006812 [Emydomyces testavorans]|uniref:Uncharacterized protein n=1 Tax=Emydomyces testavorans TaxID=2070801 RepID=A0AAF0DMI2_9EURO|nr:hypothetical protein PRK78_006812 [Emydomyces testavorans]
MERSTPRAHLQQICFSKSDSQTVLHPFHADSSTRAEENLRLESHLLRLYPRESWPKECYRAACPHPILLHPQHHQSLQALHEALTLAVTNIVERWWTDTAARFPERMPLEPHEEDLLRWMENEAVDAIRPFNECRGSWRPDFLVEEMPCATGLHSIAERFVICEINARFSFNGFCLSVTGQQGLSNMGAEQKRFTGVLEPNQVTGELCSLFDSARPLHLLKGEEHGMDIHLFVEDVERRTGMRPKFITPSDLRLVPSQDSKSGYKLCCTVKGEGSQLPDAVHGDTMKARESAQLTHEGEVLEEVHQVGLELHQRELRALPPEMLREIALRCFNDMRTILFVHDKRLLGIVLQELGDLVFKHGILSETQAQILRDGIAPSIIPGSPELEEFIHLCKDQPELKDNYLLKSIRSGKGAGIIFGDEISGDEWQDKLESLRQPSLAPDRTSYIVQRQVKQRLYDVLLRETDGLQRNRLIGTYLSIDGKFLGIGTWRSGPGRICAISHGGAFLFSVMSSRHHAEKAKEGWNASRYLDWLQFIGSWIRRRLVNRSKSVD